jgi:Na+/H+-dicarboxylate symporter
MTQAEATSGNIFTWYFRVSILKRIIFGLIAGVIVGIIVSMMGEGRTYEENTRFFGALFIHLLQMIVVPVIFFSVVAGASALNPRKLGRVGGKLTVLYLATTFIAVFLAMLAASIFQPGVGLSLGDIGAAADRMREAQPMSQVFLNLIPRNPFQALASFPHNMLPILFFAISFGIALSIVRDSADEEVRKAADTVYYFCSGAAEATYKIVWGVMQYAPIGVFFLISGILGRHGAGILGELSFVVLLFFCTVLFHFFVVYGAILKFLGGFSPMTIWKGAREALVTAAVTRSSNATLPVTIRCMKENLGINPSIVSFTAPFGATVNMDGAAIYLGMCAMFIANAIGQPLGFDQMVMVALLATLGSIGTAGVPGAGVLMLIVVLTGIGLPVQAGTAAAAAYALILAIDVIMDMGRTFLNIAGDFALTPVVAIKEEDGIDMDIYNGVKAYGAKA